MVLSNFARNPVKISTVTNTGKLLAAGRLSVSAWSNVGSAKTIGQVNAYRGSSKTKMKYQSKKKIVRKGSSKVATVAAVKRMIGAVVETKQRAVSVAVGGMARDVIYSYNVTAQIVQGTADGNRVGDKVQLKSVELRGNYYTDVAAAFYRFRVITFWSGEEYNPSVTAYSAAGVSSGEIFVQPCNSNFDGVINTKAVTLVSDRVYDINSLITAYNDGVTVTGAFNVKQNFPFQAAGSMFGKTKNLYIAVIASWVSANAGPPATSGAFGSSIVAKFMDS